MLWMAVSPVSTSFPDLGLQLFNLFEDGPNYLMPGDLSSLWQLCTYPVQCPVVSLQQVPCFIPDIVPSKEHLSPSYGSAVGAERAENFLKWIHIKLCKGNDDCTVRSSAVNNRHLITWKEDASQCLGGGEDS